MTRKIKVIKEFNEILEYLLIQVSPIIGETYHFKFKQIVKSNTGVSYLVQKSDNKQEKAKANILDKLMNNLFLLKNHLIKNIDK